MASVRTHKRRLDHSPAAGRGSAVSSQIGEQRLDISTNKKAAQVFACAADKKKFIELSLCHGRFRLETAPGEKAETDEAHAHQQGGHAAIWNGSGG